MCFIRKSLDYLFSRHELKWLDDIMPESHKREKAEKKKMLENEKDDEALVFCILFPDFKAEKSCLKL